MVLAQPVQFWVMEGDKRVAVSEEAITTCLDYYTYYADKPSSDYVLTNTETVQSSSSGGMCLFTFNNDESTLIGNHFQSSEEFSCIK